MSEQQVTYECDGGRVSYDTDVTVQNKPERGHQVDIFSAIPSEPTAAYQKHSATSRRAAERAQVNLNTHLDRVLKWFQQCGKRGGTDNELITDMLAKYNMSPNTPRPRRINLWQMGRLVNTGQERDGCTVYVYYSYASDEELHHDAREWRDYLGSQKAQL